MTSRSAQLFLSLTAAGLFLASLGCRSKHKAQSPPIAIPEAFSQSGTEAAPEKWWEAFADKNLNALTEQALAGNLRLRAAWDRLEQANAVARKATAGTFPQITAGAAAARTVLENKDSSRPGSAPPGSPPVSGWVRTYGNTYNLNLAASYELDLWGRLRGNKRAAGGSAAASAEDLQASAITIAAEVCRTWFELLKSRAELKLLLGQLKTNSDHLKLMDMRFRGGQIPAMDLLRQRQQLEAVRSEVPLVKMRLETLEHQLAILTGRPPKAGGIPAGDQLPALPHPPKSGLPAQLIVRRPDIRSAFMRLSASNAKVAVAVADRFPKISLSASADTSGIKIEDLFKNWLGTLAGNILAPIFDAGGRRAEVRRARAASSEALHNWGQKILEALGEVENSLSSGKWRQQHYSETLSRLNLARTLTTLAGRRYNNGTTDYLPVLLALKSQQALERAELEGRLSLLNQRIALYRALGGGWSMKPPAKKTLNKTKASDSGENK
jgi:outer membrane protein, multidrug efflux system